VTKEQLRAARALVDWTVRDLSDATGIHRNTITMIERGRSQPTEETMATLQRALEKAGVEFTNGKRPGVRLGA
jgi:transcriptional regulator with XRE-family HTH domain